MKQGAEKSFAAICDVSKRIGQPTVENWPMASKAGFYGWCVPRWYPYR